MEKKKNPHTGHRQRMKDKARAIGIGAWPHHEVLELLLTYAIPQKDVNPLAHELIDKFGSLAGVLDVGWEQLSKIKGLGKEASLFLSLLPDIFNKYKASKDIGSVALDTTSKCVKYFKSINTGVLTMNFEKKPNCITCVDMNITAFKKLYFKL